VFIQLVILFALNFIAVEIENPFGADANDLPAEEWQLEFNRQLAMLMSDAAAHVPSMAAMVRHDDLTPTRKGSETIGKAKLNKSLSQVWDHPEQHHAASIIQTRWRKRSDCISPKGNKKPRIKIDAHVVEIPCEQEQESRHSSKSSQLRRTASLARLEDDSTHEWVVQTSSLRESPPTRAPVVSLPGVVSRQPDATQCLVDVQTDALNIALNSLLEEVNEGPVIHQTLLKGVVGNDLTREEALSASTGTDPSKKTLSAGGTTCEARSHGETSRERGHCTPSSNSGLQLEGGSGPSPHKLRAAG
jgi:hypothetical protein